MDKLKNAADRRQKTIVELVKLMNAAQRESRINIPIKHKCVVVKIPGQIGVWKGGTK